MQIGNINVGRCGKNSKCEKKNNIVCFGPYGNLPTAHSWFSDEGVSKEIVTKVTLHVGSYAANEDVITGIQLTYGSVVGPLRGAKGYTNETCNLPGPGQFFGGVNGHARTHGTFDSFIYQLGFTGTTNQQTLCLAGTRAGELFEKLAPADTTYKFAFIKGTQIIGEMLGGLHFCFESSKKEK